MAVIESTTNQGSYLIKHGAINNWNLGFQALMTNKKYKIFGKKGEGTFSEVLKCQNLKDGNYYACKKMKQQYTSWDQVNNLREIQAMKRLNPHPNIIHLFDIVFDQRSGTLALILELMDRNVYEMIKGKKHYPSESKVKGYMWQLCKAIEYLHRHGIFHRDVKPENILIKDDLLKLADFGSCRSINSKQPYTEYISTRWYRAPECLLTDGYYGYEMDIWSIGCVMYEILSLRPLFPGTNEVDQIAKIHDVIGTPNPDVLKRFKSKARSISFNFPNKKGTGLESMMLHTSREAASLVRRLCTYDPEERISAKKVLTDVYFKEYRDKEKAEVLDASLSQPPSTPASAHAPPSPTSPRYPTPTGPKSKVGHVQAAQRKSIVRFEREDEKSVEINSDRSHAHQLATNTIEQPPHLFDVNSTFVTSYVANSNKENYKPKNVPDSQSDVAFSKKSKEKHQVQFSPPMAAIRKHKSKLSNLPSPPDLATSRSSPSPRNVLPSSVNVTGGSVSMTSRSTGKVAAVMEGQRLPPSGAKMSPGLRTSLLPAQQSLKEEFREKRRRAQRNHRGASYSTPFPSSLLPSVYVPKSHTMTSGPHLLGHTLARHTKLGVMGGPVAHPGKSVLPHGTRHLGLHMGEAAASSNTVQIRLPNLFNPSIGDNVIHDSNQQQNMKSLPYKQSSKAFQLSRIYGNHFTGRDKAFNS